MWEASFVRSTLLQSLVFLSCRVPSMELIHTAQLKLKPILLKNWKFKLLNMQNEPVMGAPHGLSIEQAKNPFMRFLLQLAMNQSSCQDFLASMQETMRGKERSFSAKNSRRSRLGLDFNALKALWLHAWPTHLEFYYFLGSPSDYNRLWSKVRLKLWQVNQA